MRRSAAHVRGFLGVLTLPIFGLVLYGYGLRRWLHTEGRSHYTWIVDIQYALNRNHLFWSWL